MDLPVGFVTQPLLGFHFMAHHNRLVESPLHRPVEGDSFNTARLYISISAQFNTSTAARQTLVLRLHNHQIHQMCLARTSTTTHNAS